MTTKTTRLFFAGALLQVIPDLIIRIFLVRLMHQELRTNDSLLVEPLVALFLQHNVDLLLGVSHSSRWILS